MIHDYRHGGGQRSPNYPIVRPSPLLEPFLAVCQQLIEAERARDRLRERVQATAEVGCVNSPAGRRWPMKCLPKDPCSFCRARALLESL